MTDICKCNNKNCKIRNSCYRFLADDSDYQAYFIVDKVVDNENDCNEYWKVTNDKEIERLNKLWAD